MEDIRILTDKFLQIHPDQKTAFLLAGYQEGLPGYDKALEFFEGHKRSLLQTLQTRGVLGFTKDRLVLFVTLGSTVSRRIDRFFEEGEELEGALFSAMADSYLFAFEYGLHEILYEIVRARGYGIRRLEEADPGEYIPYVEEFSKKTGLGISVNEAGILFPKKSMILLFELDENPEVFEIGEACDYCNRKDCSLRNHQRKEVKKFETHREVEIPAHRNLLDYLQEIGEKVAAPCGGKGICGKCQVEVKEIGKVLACQTSFDHPVLALLEEEQKAKSTRSDLGIFEEKLEKKLLDLEEGQGLFAIDLGTTTLAASLLTREGQWTKSKLNSQAVFGADVISRIKASKEKADQLQEAIWSDIVALTKDLLKDHPFLSIKRMVLVGNTTMIHLLLHYPCKGLGTYPFKPYHLDRVLRKAGELYSSVPEALRETEVLIEAGASAFVGADLTAGVYGLFMDESRDVNLLIDLGTNGEMVLGRKGDYYLASTAIGPAFEGGAITFGLGGVLGAITQVEKKSDCLGGLSKEEVDLFYKQPDNFLKLTIIGEEQTPLGIAGVGLLSALALFLREGLIDAHGTIEDAFFERGIPLGYREDGVLITISQEDIRQVQLAKAAVHGGILALVRESPFDFKDIKKVYLAGGFGFYLNLQDAKTLDLFPKELQADYVACGNTALLGAKWIALEDGRERVENYRSACKEVVLANSELFQEAYLSAMDFNKRNRMEEDHDTRGI